MGVPITLEIPLFLVFFPLYGGFLILSLVYRWFPFVYTGNENNSSFLLLKSKDNPFEKILKNFKLIPFEMKRSKIIILTTNTTSIMETTKLIRKCLKGSRNNDVVFIQIIEKKTNPYYNGIETYNRRLIQGLNSETNNKFRYCSIDETIVDDPRLFEVLSLFMNDNSKPREIFISQSELVKPKVFRLHVMFLLLSAIIFVVFGHPSITMFNPETLKPKLHFDPLLKQIATYTNIPIKYGLIHGLLYCGEFFLDRELFKRHIGQRVTTLWYQLLQHHRYGQHLQMQVETLLQIADVMKSKTLGKRTLVLILLWIVSIGVLLQNAFTSYGWHSIQEQALGFVLICFKYFVFDLSYMGTRVNNSVGNLLASGLQWLGGLVTLTGAFALNNFGAIHPTLIATLVFLGGFLVLLLLKLLRK